MPGKTVAVQLSPARGAQGDRIVVGADVDFSTPFGSLAVATQYDCYFVQQQQTGVFDIPRTLWVDNSVNPNQLFVIVSQTGQNFPIPPYTVAQVPIYAQASSVVSLISLGGATDLITVQFYNTREPPFAYSGFAPVTPGFLVATIPPSAKTLTSKNAALVGGVAQNVFGAVGSSLQRRFRNIGNDLAFYNMYGLAASGNFANGDLEIQPDPNWTTIPYQTLGAISFYCVNACNIEAQEIGF